MRPALAIPAVTAKTFDWLVLWLTRDASRRSRQAVEALSHGPLTWAFAGAACRNRTDDLLITSESLYRLS